MLTQDMIRYTASAVALTHCSSVEALLEKWQTKFMSALKQRSGRHSSATRLSYKKDKSEHFSCYSKLYYL